jgi:hypothetical protein
MRHLQAALRGALAVLQQVDNTCFHMALVHLELQSKAQPNLHPGSQHANLVTASIWVVNSN